MTACDPSYLRHRTVQNKRSFVLMMTDRGEPRHRRGGRSPRGVWGAQPPQFGGLFFPPGA